MNQIISNVILAYTSHLEGNDVMAAMYLQKSGEIGKALYMKIIKELKQ